MNTKTKQDSLRQVSLFYSFFLSFTFQLIQRMFKLEYLCTLLSQKERRPMRY